MSRPQVEMPFLQHTTYELNLVIISTTT